MIALGFGLVGLGYAVGYYGYYQLQGATAAFVSYILPGRAATERGYMFQSPCKGQSGGGGGSGSGSGKGKTLPGKVGGKKVPVTPANPVTPIVM